MLKLTNVNLKIIQDTGKYKFVESTIRGGIFTIWKDYTEAKNKFLKLYDANKPSSYIICLDANKLYGIFMMQLLPTEMLDWVNPKDLNLHNYSNDSQIGYFLEVDLNYSKELHDLDNDYHLASEKESNINYKS